MPIARQVRIMRRAISPRFAINIRRKIIGLSFYISFRNSVSTASSFRGVSAKRRPGGTLCFLFQSKGHTICKKAIAASSWLLATALGHEQNHVPQSSQRTQSKPAPETRRHGHTEKQFKNHKSRNYKSLFHSRSFAQIRG